jgi:hypothetical protein
VSFYLAQCVACLDSEIGLAKAVLAVSHLADVQWENANPKVFQSGDDFMHDLFHAAWTRGSGAKCAEFRSF